MVTKRYKVHDIYIFSIDPNDKKNIDAEWFENNLKLGNTYVISTSYKYANLLEKKIVENESFHEKSDIWKQIKKPSISLVLWREFTYDCIDIGNFYMQLLTFNHENKISDLLHCLQLVQPIYINYKYSARLLIDVDGQQYKEPYIFFDYFTGDFSKINSIDHRIFPTPNEIIEASEIYDLYTNKKNDISIKIKHAFYFFLLSKAIQQPYISFLINTIGFEVLFNISSEQVTNQLISRIQQVAEDLPNKNKDRILSPDEFDELYKIRSEIIHTGSIKNNDSKKKNQINLRALLEKSQLFLAEIIKTAFIDETFANKFLNEDSINTAWPYEVDYYKKGEEYINQLKGVLRKIADGEQKEMLLDKIKKIHDQYHPRAKRK